MKKLRKATVICLAAVVALSMKMCVFGFDEVFVNTIREKQLEFASQYKYNEGDFDKSFTLYPGINYTSGIEYTQDGRIYECPAIYIDEYAMYVNDYSLKKGEAKFVINGKKNQYYDQCVLYNSRLLVPANVFTEVGCDVTTDKDTYVTTIYKDGVTLEILPNLIGMRKNRHEGFYVPLEVCARLIDDTLYVPVRAVSNEIGLDVSWDSQTSTVALNI